MLSFRRNNIIFFKTVMASFWLLGPVFGSIDDQVGNLFFLVLEQIDIIVTFLFLRKILDFFVQGLLLKDIIRIPTFFTLIGFISIESLKPSTLVFLHRFMDIQLIIDKLFDAMTLLILDEQIRVYVLFIMKDDLFPEG